MGGAHLGSLTLAAALAWSGLSGRLDCIIPHQLGHVFPFLLDSRRHYLIHLRLGRQFILGQLLNLRFLYHD